MSEPFNRLTNMFGALVLGIADRVRWAARDETTLGGETAAALVVIGHTPGLSINQLGRVLRLSHPGAVRLVDRLTASGLAMRSAASHDRRVVVLNLTETGDTHRAALLERRRKVLETIISEVPPEDLAVLERITDRMIRTLSDDAISALNICRLCNERQCVDCPMNGFGPLN